MKKLLIALVISGCAWDTEFQVSYENTVDPYGTISTTMKVYKNATVLPKRE